tara:strand:- start:16591 stop:17172 length:582 start_codon:yes stop_codon:yes gene_type:complete
MSTYTDICEDCGKLCELVLTPACADDHTSNYMCCQKYICKNGCDIHCHECNAINNIQSIDGFYFEEPCIACKQPLSFSFTWFGPDIITACERYCMVNCFKNKKIMKLNTKYNDEKYNIFLYEIEDLFSYRLHPSYYNKLKFKTIEELNKSLNYPSPNTNKILKDIFTNRTEDIDILNNKTKEVISEIWGINLY